MFGSEQGQSVSWVYETGPSRATRQRCRLPLSGLICTASFIGTVPTATTLQPAIANDKVRALAIYRSNQYSL